jgi:hypothetical protein
LKKKGEKRKNLVDNWRKRRYCFSFIFYAEGGHGTGDKLKSFSKLVMLIYVFVWANGNSGIEILMLIKGSQSPCLLLFLHCLWFYPLAAVNMVASLSKSLISSLLV